MVKYTLSLDNNQIFTSKYILHLPTEKELLETIKNEQEQFLIEKNNK